MFHLCLFDGNLVIWTKIQEFHIVIVTVAKAPHHSFGNSPKICRLVDLGVNKVQAVQVPLAFFIISSQSSMKWEY